MKKETDHIWPRVEGGPDKPWNKRIISQRENRQKGAKMPHVADISDSSNPIRLAVEIDKHSLDPKGFKHPRNKGRGFGGLPRYRP